jgi:hypothetical protein
MSRRLDDRIVVADGREQAAEHRGQERAPMERRAYGAAAESGGLG